MLQEQYDNHKASFSAEKSELVAEIERYAEMVEQLTAENALLKESLKNSRQHSSSKSKSAPEKKQISSSSSSNKKNSDDLFMPKTMGTAEDVCAALNSFVQNHSGLLIPGSDITSWFDDKPSATATIEVKEPVKPSKSSDTWSFNDPKYMSNKSSPSPESPINPENLISMLFVSFY